MSDYLGLGLRSVVNAGGAQSRLGGSTLSAEVRDAMSAAATEYVEIESLHDIVGRRLAAATRNEAAAVSAGSAAAVMIAVAATIAGADPTRAAALPRAESPRDVAVWRAHTTGVLAGADSVHDNGYLNSIAAGGGHVRIVDDPTDVRPGDAAFVWFPGMYGIADEDALLAEAAAHAGSLGVPVIVDAADQVPPFSRTWDYTTSLGADLAIFSGGKGLHGPTSSGLIVGRADLIAACRVNSGTEHGVGRPAKVGREELLGLLVAVEHASRLDEEARYAAQELVVERWREHLAGLGSRIQLEPVPRGHCGQLVPRLVVRLASGSRECRDALIDELWESDPRLAVLPEVRAAVALSPQLVVDDQADWVASRVHDVFAAHLDSCALCR